MNNLSNYIVEKLKLDSNIKIKEYNYHPKDRDELKSLIEKLIKERGDEADLNDIDVSNVKDMSYLFINSYFNGDISKWDVSNVKNMFSMFNKSDFNGDISKWDVSNVTDMRLMFYDSKFNGDISKWDVSNVTNIKDIFKYSLLKKNPPSWYHE